jgi:hypothetical protein
VPAALASSTIKAAIAFAAGKAAAGLVSASVAALTDGVIHAMFLTKLKFATAALLAVALLGTGTGLFVRQALAGKPAIADRAVTSERPAEKEPEKKADRPAREEPRGKEVVGKVAAIAKDGKSFTMEIASPIRGEDPQKLEVKIDDKTTVAYHNVGPDGAKMTESYGAHVRLKEGSKEVAESVTFLGSADGTRRGADLTGKVTAIAKDDKGVTIETLPARGRGDDRLPPMTVDIKFNDRTVVLFSNVAKGAAKLTEGYLAEVMLEDGPKGTTAAVINLRGPEQGLPRGKQPQVTGPIAAVGKDGKSITVLMQPKERGEEPQKLEVQLTDKTSVVYFNVGPDGTKLAEGLQVHVLMEDGSKDKAYFVGVAAVPKQRWATIEGKVVGVSRDGKRITLEGRPTARGEDPPRFDVNITDKTKVAYYGVDTGGAKPSEEYYARALLVDGSKDVALAVMFAKPGTGRR